MADLGGLIRKEFGRIRSDKRSLVLLFAIPLILIVVFGLTSGGGPTKYFTVSIVNRDGMPVYNELYPSDSNSTEHGDYFVNLFIENSTTFTVHQNYTSLSESDYTNHSNLCFGQIKNELIDAYIVIPENFSETIDHDNKSSILYVVDGSDLQSVDAIEVALQEPIALFRISNEIYENFTMMLPNLEYDVPFWEKQVLNYALPMILCMIIMGLDMNLTSLSIVSEGPLPRMLLTPTGKLQIVLSKLISYTVIMVLQVTEIFIVSAAFGMFSLGSLFQLFFVLCIIGFVGICMGLFISAVARTEQIANQIYMMFFIVIVIFSGSFIPADLLPAFFKPIINVLPLSHAIPIVVDLTLKGLPIMNNFNHLLVLIIQSLVFLILGYIIYQLKKIEV